MEFREEMQPDMQDEMHPHRHCEKVIRLEAEMGAMKEWRDSMTSAFEKFTSEVRLDLRGVERSVSRNQALSQKQFIWLLGVLLAGFMGLAFAMFQWRFMP